MKTLFLLFVTTILLFGTTKIEVLKNFKNSNYKSVCFDGYKLLKDNRTDEVFINAVAYSCLQIDVIDLLAKPIIYLKKTPLARQNAAYYSTILYQKKMLYHALIDGIDISGIRTPQTNYILSIIFDKYVKGEYKKAGEVYIIEYKDSIYKVSVFQDRRYKKIKIEHFQNQKLQKTYYYW